MPIFVSSLSSFALICIIMKKMQTLNEQFKKMQCMEENTKGIPRERVVSRLTPEPSAH